MTKRLEVEITDAIKQEIDTYARKKGLRRPFAYGNLLEIGLQLKLKEEDNHEPKEQKPNDGS